MRHFDFIHKTLLRLTGFLVRQSINYGTGSKNGVTRGDISWDQKGYRTKIEISEL